MALARWKDLCIDALDPARLGAFWAEALSLTAEDAGDGDVRLVAEGQPGRTIWVNRVPEPKSVKHRVHPDLRDDLDRLLALGATVLREPTGDERWHVLGDPEGGELCLFTPVPEWPAGDGFFELVVDSVDPAGQATWWAQAIGGVAQGQDGKAFHWVQDIADVPFLFLVFTPVPEPKAVKNRWHWDVVCDDLDGLLAHGATVLREPTGDDEWHVLADPEGNEFCSFAPAVGSGG